MGISGSNSLRKMSRAVWEGKRYERFGGACAATIDIYKSLLVAMYEIVGAKPEIGSSVY